MRHGTLIFILLMFMSTISNGQDFPDRIVTSSGDTIHCCITLVNGESIFYYHLQRDIRRPGNVSLASISDYTWTHSCSHQYTEEEPFRKQKKERKKWGYGVKLVQQFNMPVMHTILAFNVNKGNHNLYVGPHYTHLAEKRIKNESDISYAQNTYGLNFGYNVIIKTRNEHFDVFMQLDCSIYQAEFWYVDGPYSEIYSEEKVVAENCISTGIKYNFSDKFSVLGGYGFGSTDGFFFEFDEVIPQIYFGMHYQIK